MLIIQLSSDVTDDVKLKFYKSRYVCMNSREAASHVPGSCWRMDTKRLEHPRTIFQANDAHETKHRVRGICTTVGVGSGAQCVTPVERKTCMTYETDRTHDNIN